MCIVNSNNFLFIASYPESLINFRRELVEAVICSGISVHIAVPSFNDAKLFSCFSGYNFSVHVISLERTGNNPFKDISYTYQLYSLMKKIKPEYVLGYTIKPVVYGLIAAFLAKIPNRFALITGLGYVFVGGREQKILRAVVNFLYKFSLKFAHKVFFQNPDDERLFRKFNLLNSSTVSHVVNGSGVNLEQFAVVPLSQKVSFLLIARLLGDKGVREYVAAAKKVKKVFPSIEFMLVGWIDEGPDSISQSELDLWISDGAITFLGKLPDVRTAISSCSVYVLPSYREGTPRTVLEAMAMGRAIITTDAPGCRETVVDGVNGFLVPVKSVGVLEKTMCSFIEDPMLAISMGRKSREIIEDKYDVHKVNTVMLKEMGIL